MNFDESVRYLLGLGHETVAVKLGLDNIERLLEHLGRPQDSFTCVQIAGTNGKGSTASTRRPPPAPPSSQSPRSRSTIRNIWAARSPKSPPRRPPSSGPA